MKRGEAFARYHLVTDELYPKSLLAYPNFLAWLSA